MRTGLIRCSPLLTGLALDDCFERADRWYLDETPPCEVGTRRCLGNLEICVDTERGPTFVLDDDCEARGKVCAPTLLACTECVPASRRCDGFDAQRCDNSGSGFETVETCN